MTYANIKMTRSGGYTLIEVLVGILIFAVGMMALAQLQGNLAQNSGDANARTVAINVAEELVETARSFAQVTSDGGTTHAYNDIVDSTDTVTRAGYTYSVITDVTDYYYVPDSKTFSDTKPEGSGAANSDFKHIELTVTWQEAGGREFRIDNETTANMGSGSITITDVISSITSPASGKVLLGTGGEDNMFAPPVDYSPGQNPDIVSINLGNSKFKESTTPLPDVIRTDELVETRFDVVTYSNPINSSATFLRREEFRAVSCECTLRVPTTGNQGGLRPTVWTGSDYTEGEFVSKPYGESANNQQSDFCDICCRDHHDGGTGSFDDSADLGRSRYNPFLAASSDYHQSGSFLGDHKHYNRDNSGNLVEANTDGATYVEACRLVRKDGFFRVAQDLRQEGMNAFPQDYLDDSTDIDEYSSYVKAAVFDFESTTRPMDAYETSTPDMLSPGDLSYTFPASTPGTATLMSSSNGVEEQQLRSRGIYIDYMNDELRTKISCLSDGGDGDSCNVPEVSSAIEIIPFYDVQLTWLSRWTESPNNYPVEVSNESISNNNAHSRGLATLTGGNLYSQVFTSAHKGNLGLTATDPIDLHYLSDIESYRLFAKNGDSGDAPSVLPVQISGTITSSVGNLAAADVDVVGINALCDRTLTGYECVPEEGVNKPEILVSNYFKKNQDVYACNDSGELVVHGTEHSGDIPDQNWTKFYLPTDGTTTTANIVIRQGGC